MKAPPERFVLAIYPAGEEGAEPVLQAVREITRGRAFLFGPDRVPIPAVRPIERYSELRLDGEYFLAAEVKPPDVEATVKRLQNTGSPAVFVVSPELRS